jgi:hypothetical protein
MAHNQFRLFAPYVYLMAIPAICQGEKLEGCGVVDKFGFYSYTCDSEETMLSIRYMVSLKDKIKIDIPLEDISKEVVFYYEKICIITD